MWQILQWKTGCRKFCIIVNVIRFSSIDERKYRWKELVFKVWFSLVKIWQVLYRVVIFRQNTSRSSSSSSTFSILMVYYFSSIGSISKPNPINSSRMLYYFLRLSWLEQDFYVFNMSSGGMETKCFLDESFLSLRLLRFRMKFSSSLLLELCYLSLSLSCLVFLLLIISAASHRAS